MNLLCCVVMFVLKKVRLSIIKIKKRFCYLEWPRILFSQPWVFFYVVLSYVCLVVFLIFWPESGGTL